MAKKQKHSRYSLPECFLFACEEETKKSRRSPLYWRYVAEILASAFYETNDDAFFDFIGFAIDPHKAAIREKHPEILLNPDEYFYAFTDEEFEQAFFPRQKR